MDSSRVAAIASALLAHEALTLVSAHHPRGLASFAVDAHVARCELDLALSGSGRGVREAYVLAFLGRVVCRILACCVTIAPFMRLTSCCGLWRMMLLSGFLTSRAVWMALLMSSLRVLSVVIRNRYNVIGER